MAAPNSKSTICQLALDYLQEDNQEPIVDIDNPTTDIEVTFARWYDTTRRSLLRKKPWNFAIKRAVLNPTGQTPAFGYQNEYDLPNDFIRFLTIEDPGIFSKRFLTDYVLESNKILTDSTNSAQQTSSEILNLRYIFDVTSITAMDPIFIDLFAIDLAENVAYKFTVSNTNVERLNGLRTQKMTEAAAIAGQENPPVRVERSAALARRRQSGGQFGTDQFNANI